MPVPVDDLTRAVARLLKARFEASRYTYDTLADATHISRASVVRKLKGERQIDVPELYALSAALGLDPKTLLSDAEALL